MWQIERYRSVKWQLERHLGNPVAIKALTIIIFIFQIQQTPLLPLEDITMVLNLILISCTLNLSNCVRLGSFYKLTQNTVKDNFKQYFHKIL